MQKTVMVIDDDEKLQKYLRRELLEAGFNVISHTSALEALENLKSQEPDIVVLDLHFPRIKGEVVCQDIKKRYPELPIVILTAKNDIETLTNSFEIGADDYIAKPFNTTELIARINARLTKNSTNKNSLNIGDLEIDDQRKTVTRGGKKIKLTAKEYNLLKYLVLNKDRVVTRDMILSRVWSFDYYIDTRVVDVYVGYLRRKVDTGFEHKLIRTIRGFGYQIKI